MSHTTPRSTPGPCMTSGLFPPASLYEAWSWRPGKEVQGRGAEPLSLGRAPAGDNVPSGWAPTPRREAHLLSAEGRAASRPSS